MEIPLLLNGHEVLAIVDSAAEATVVSSSLAKAAGITDWENTIVKLAGAFHDTKTTGKKVKGVPVQLGDWKCHCDVIISDLNDPMLLGCDFLRNNRCTINFNNNTVTIGSNTIQAVRKIGPGGEVLPIHKVSVTNRTIIPPNSIKLITGTILSSPPNVTPSAPSEMVIEPYPDLDGLVIPKVLADASGTEICFIALNHTSKFKTLRSNQPIGSAVEVESILDEDEESDQRPVASPEFHLNSVKFKETGKHQASINLQEVPPHLQSLLERSAKELNAQEKEVLEHFLCQYADVFAKSDLDLGNFTAVQHRIDTGDAKPIRHRMRRTPLGFEDEEEKHLAAMLQANVIQPSKSEWAAAPVLVRKKDGSVRYCIDYRGLNAHTVKDAYPLPLIEQCLDMLAGNKFFSTLDLAAGYWQVNIHPNDQHKTAFITKFGLYEFSRMSFGLCNAPATFQRAINLVLRGLNWKEVLAYLDDVIVMGSSFEEGLENLKMVLERFRKFNLKLKPKKCTLFQTTIEFLGKKIGPDGVSISDTKLLAVNNWKVPRNIKELESFLGFMNYHREFIPQYAKVADCLYKITGSRGSWNWEEQHQQAFETLKSLALNAPVLTLPNTEGTFLLDTDASDIAIGAELLQKQNGKEVTIAYASAVLSPAQRKYCTTRKELLAVVTFTRLFRHYLLGRKIYVRTDHQSLVWLMRFKYPQGQLARWLEELSQYDMDILHRPGRHHQNADALSRLPDTSDVCDCYHAGIQLSSLPCGGCGYCSRVHNQWERFEIDVDDVVPLAVKKITTSSDDDVRLTSYSMDELREWQEKDEDLGTIINWLENEYEPTQAELTLCSQAVKHLWLCKPQLHLHSNVLYYKWEGMISTMKLVVPHALRSEVLLLVHDVKSAGHLGQNKTLLRLKQNFYWYNMSQDANLYVQSCAICNRNKKPSRHARAELGTYHAGAPMERVHIDMLGPFTESYNRNRYILMVVDQFTKWVQCFPVPDQSTEVVCQNLIERCFSNLGMPLQIHTDQGKNFQASLFKEMCRVFEITKTRTTPYRPCSNGQVERYNTVVLQMMRCYLQDEQRDWDKHLSLIGMAMRSTVNRNTGFTPNLLMLGREISIPGDVFGVNRLNQGASDPPEYLRRLLDMLEKAGEVARRNLGQAQRRQKRDYDLHIKQKMYGVGDLVYKRDTTQVKGQSTKLKSPFVGPYLVIEVLSPVLYRVEGRSKTQVLHHDRLRICEDRDIPLWIRRKRNALLENQSPLAQDKDDAHSSSEHSISHQPPADDVTISQDNTYEEQQSLWDDNEDLGLKTLFKDVLPRVIGAESPTSRAVQPVASTTRAGRTVRPPKYLGVYAT
jgi:transposase InsO family protein